MPSVNYHATNVHIHFDVQVVLLPCLFGTPSKQSFMSNPKGFIVTLTSDRNLTACVSASKSNI